MKTARVRVLVLLAVGVVAVSAVAYTQLGKTPEDVICNSLTDRRRATQTDLKCEASYIGPRTYRVVVRGNYSGREVEDRCDVSDYDRDTKTFNAKCN